MINVFRCCYCGQIEQHPASSTSRPNLTHGHFGGMYAMENIATVPEPAFLMDSMRLVVSSSETEQAKK